MFAVTGVMHACDIWADKKANKLEIIMTGIHKDFSVAMNKKYTIAIRCISEYSSINKWPQCLGQVFTMMFQTCLNFSPDWSKNLEELKMHIFMQLQWTGHLW